LLVVDAAAEEFFSKCNVQPTEEHITGKMTPCCSGLRVKMALEMTNGDCHDFSVFVGPLPEPVSERGSDEGLCTRTATLSPNACVQVERTPQHESSQPAETLSLNLSLAQAKERAHQKRAAKKAPQMDWSKRNELFSNL
ncbi:hypothetical protein XENOCAPTIV_011070, partial [Xenoophorus captivus]